MKRYRYTITVGAKTTAGGTVTSGCYFAEIEGKLIACEGDSIVCPACGTIGKIGCVGPRIEDLFDGKNSALEDDICLCKCSPPPRLIANQNLRCQVVDDNPTASRSVAAPANTPMPQRASAPAAPVRPQATAAQRSAPPIVPARQSLTPELIAVAGSQHDSGRGNKMMFIGQAVRELAEFRRYRTDRIRTLVVFTPTYNGTMLDQARKSARIYGAGFVSVTNVQELIDYLNRGKDRKQSPIEHLSLFSHGVPQQVAFGYQLAETAQMSLNVENYEQISPEAFSRSALIESYACRTGMANSPDLWVEEGVQFYPQTNESLAQLLANHTRLTVRAFIRRSDYKNTWGTFEERQLLKGCETLNNTELIACRELRKLNDERKENVKTYDFTYQNIGATSPVISGGSPKGVPEGFHAFLPQ